MSEAFSTTSTESRAQTIRVLLADDHPALRVGLRVLLEQAPGVQVVGEAGDGAEALAQIELLRPDVAVLDCQLPEMEGVQLAAEIVRRGIGTRVLALSAYKDDKYVRGMMKAGAVGYLLKEEAPRVIVAAVQAAVRGEGWFSPEVAAKVAAWQRGEHPEQPDLTERELEVLRLVAKGKANKEIANSLSVTERTIEFHVGNVLNKLGVASRVEAAVWFRDRGGSMS